MKSQNFLISLKYINHFLLFHILLFPLIQLGYHQYFNYYIQKSYLIILLFKYHIIVFFSLQKLINPYKFFVNFLQIYNMKINNDAAQVIVPIVAQSQEIDDEGIFNQISKTLGWYQYFPSSIDNSNQKFSTNDNQ
ncbi:unnamed protein product [Paramecium pentaurelia]|uniref:Transmembrane protein n=1 Tax=Paramecium pentaurelia TaxID=43138 RepID=A0A8S1Y2W6_9CILI|nr:unnamed protein product [Paramecium pentaurelia]